MHIENNVGRSPLRCRPSIINIQINKLTMDFTTSMRIKQQFLFFFSSRKKMEKSNVSNMSPWQWRQSPCQNRENSPTPSSPPPPHTPFHSWKYDIAWKIKKKKQRTWTQQTGNFNFFPRPNQFRPFDFLRFPSTSPIIGRAVLATENRPQKIYKITKVQNFCAKVFRKNLFSKLSLCLFLKISWAFGNSARRN